MIRCYTRMFDLEIETNTHSSVTRDEEGRMSFSPPVYMQRHIFTGKVLEKFAAPNGQLKKIVEFGCGKMKLCHYMKRTEGVEHIMQIDIDEDLLRQYRRQAEPLLDDYIKRNPRPYKVEVLVGSIDTPSNSYHNTDVVVAIEVIEHLQPDTLIDMQWNIFGFIRPKIVLISTPNIEYNVLFNNLRPTGFRHYDHKFEWTRDEFRDWALNICERYPNYLVNIFGVGMPPASRQEVGYVTQYAVFVRKDVLNQPLVDSLEPIYVDHDDKSFIEIYRTEIPAYVDSRTFDEQVYDEAVTFVRFYISIQESDDNYQNMHKIPMSRIMANVAKLTTSESDVVRILSNSGYIVDNDHLIVAIESKLRLSGYWLDDQVNDYSDEELYEDDRILEEEERFYEQQRLEREQNPELYEPRYIEDHEEECWD